MIRCSSGGGSLSHALHSRRYFAPERRAGVHWRPRGEAPLARCAGSAAGGEALALAPRSPTVGAMAANGTAAPETRLCHVRKVPTFDGYGFNLHAEKGKPGQYIGKVDAGSPAEAAGLRRGDRILEVNGHSIAGESHKQVVSRIKERPDDAELLVAAPAPGDPLPDLDPPETTTSSTPTPPASEVDAPTPEPVAPPPRLNLQMTAAEMRAHLAAKKKVDPKKVPMDLKSKFDIVKKL